MDSKKEDTTDSATDSPDVKEHHDHAGEPVIESVARGIGTAIGVVASTAAKVISKAESAEPELRFMRRSPNRERVRNLVPPQTRVQLSFQRTGWRRRKRNGPHTETS